VSGGLPGSNGGEGGRDGGERILGWSKQSAARNARFLQSVDLARLDGRGIACTFTVKDVPETFDHWQVIVLGLLRWVGNRPGWICTHCATEWTKAQRPHLHLWAQGDWDAVRVAELAEDWWLDHTRHLGTMDRGQWARPIKVKLRLNWAMYTAKHAARGVGHYQRERELIPEGWDRTGRMWAKRGAWPVAEDKLEVDDEDWWHLRRVLARLARSRVVLRLRLELVTVDGLKRERELRGLTWRFHPDRSPRVVTSAEDRTRERRWSDYRWRKVRGLVSRLCSVRSMIRRPDPKSGRAAGFGGFVDDSATVWALLAWAEHRGARLPDAAEGAVARARFHRGERDQWRRMAWPPLVVCSPKSRRAERRKCMNMPGDAFRLPERCCP
jgi:hypothetical protein